MAGLDFYGCVKLVNYIRTEVATAETICGYSKAVAGIIEEEVLSSRGSAFADEK